jgi:hypothetical protein
VERAESRAAHDFAQKLIDDMTASEEASGLVDRADRELERLLERRYDPRDGEALLEPTYAESVRRYNAKLQAANREMWTQFHREQAERHHATLERLIQDHERRAEELCED